MQPRNMSMSGVVDLAAVKAAQEAKAKAEQARAEAARTGGTGAVSPADLVIDVDEAGFDRDVRERELGPPQVHQHLPGRGEDRGVGRGTAGTPGATGWMAALHGTTITGGNRAVVREITGNRCRAPAPCHYATTRSEST